ncbi:SCO7613 C-terminal domain-containing membrane protein [Streptomyces sp. NPDC054887]
MENAPPPAEELVILDRELGLLDARRAQLLARRAWLIGVLQQAAAQQRPQHPPHPFPPAAPRDASPRGAQNVLLTLGGILLTIAAIAFTLVSWGYLGIGGRSAVLAAVTALALAAPALLLRRGLVSTAESVGALGLALTVLDAYALHRVALPGTDGLAYAAGCSAALAALWTAYGLALGRLRLPLPAALITAQFPFVLWATAVDAGALGLTWALLATAALDVVVALWGPGRAVRPTAAVAAWLTGTAALLGAGAMSLTAADPAAALRPGATLLAVAALAVFAAWRTAPVAHVRASGGGATASHAGEPAPQGPAAPPRPTAPERPEPVATHALMSSAVAGLAVTAAFAGVLRPALPDAWAVPAYVLCAVALLAVVRLSLPRPMALGAAGASGAVLALGLLWALPPAAVTLLGPAARAGHAWSGAPAGVREALSPTYPWAGSATAPLVLLTVAAVAAAAHRATAPGPAWRTPAVCAAVALAWSAAYTAPAALDLGHPAALVVHALLTAALLVPAVRPALTGAAGPRAPLPLTALACALASASTLSLLSLAERGSTFAVLGLMAALFGASAVLARGPVVPAVSAAAAVVYATGLAGACAASLALPPHRAALLVLTVPAVAAVLAARIRGHVTGLPLEVSGAAAGLLAIGLAVGDAPTLALVLALCGLIAAGTAVRADRRPVGYAAAVLLVLATWVRLGASDVVTPEAYTLPVTVPALVIGVLRRRRDTRASSWTAYGPGLAATFLPSVIAVWGDPHWLRPLLLGAAALAVTLTGARHRLQALLVLGSAALALVALHELAPYVVQVVGVLPRWLPPALAGLLLLGVGATYEQRLRDARRLRDALGRMR